MRPLPAVGEIRFCSGHLLPAFPHPIAALMGCGIEVIRVRKEGPAGAAIFCEQATKCCGFLFGPVREAGEGESQAYAIYDMEILACAFTLRTRRGLAISPFLSRMI